MAKQGEAEVYLENKRSAVSLVIHKKDKDIDCHEFDKSNSRNDKISSYNVGIIDCHANASAFARNDGKAAYNDERLTHPQTPSASEGALRESNTVTLRDGASRSFSVNKTLCHTEGVARSISKNISKDSANNTRQKRDISLALNMTTDKSVDY